MCKKKFLLIITCTAYRYIILLTRLSQGCYNIVTTMLQRSHNLHVVEAATIHLLLSFLVFLSTQLLSSSAFLFLFLTFPATSPVPQSPRASHMICQHHTIIAVTTKLIPPTITFDSRSCSLFCNSDCSCL